MAQLFYNKNTFNGDIRNWDVRAVTSMSRMFHAASAFDQDISGWNVAAVTEYGEHVLPSIGI